MLKARFTFFLAIVFIFTNAACWGLEKVKKPTYKTLTIKGSLSRFHVTDHYKNWIVYMKNGDPSDAPPVENKKFSISPDGTFQLIFHDVPIPFDDGSYHLLFGERSKEGLNGCDCNSMGLHINSNFVDVGVLNPNEFEK